MADKYKYPRYFVCLRVDGVANWDVSYVFFRKHNSQARIIYKDGHIRKSKFYLSSMLRSVENGYNKEVPKEELVLII